jgi:glycosyltransferase involved in cell wall biosynthesis
MTSGDSVSVVIPAYNAARYVAPSLRSVLEQTMTPGEVIVVDDGSTDETASIVARARRPVRLVRQAHLGYAATMNRGVAEASGPLLAFQDADDLWMPRKLEWQIAALDEDPALDAVFGQFESFLSPDLPDADRARYRVPPVMAAYQLQTMLIRRAAFDRVGPVDPLVGTGGAIDWVSRARAAALRMKVLDEVVGRRRIHDDNMDIREAQQRRGELLTTLRAHRGRMRRRPDQDDL